MSKTKTTLTRDRIFNLYNALTALAKLAIDPKLRYCIAKNRPSIEAEIKATQEAIGEQKPDATADEIEQRNALARKMGEEVVEIDLVRYVGIPEFDDVVSFPDDSAKRCVQNQAIMEAILPIIADEN